MNGPARVSRQGQSLVIVTLLLFALMGMLALALDGGNGFFQRRRAQNAADAGALAGARELCLVEGDLPTKQAAAAGAAWEYAVVRNGALDATFAWPDPAVIQVDTVITFPTTFGNVLGLPEMGAHAVAAAGCFIPSGGNGVLPVAWSCHPYIGANGYPKCDIEFEHSYIVMDSEKTGTDLFCQDPPNSGTPAGTLDCDFDDDNVNDVIVGGDRSWLDLDGEGGGTSDLVDWVNGSQTANVEYHHWYGSETGADVNVFIAAGDKVGTDVLIPVFDKYCDVPGAPDTNACYSTLWDPGDVVVYKSGGSVFYYHIIGFSVFHIECVDKGGQTVAESGYTLAPGKRCHEEYEAIQQGFYTPPAADLKVIEGYFKTGVIPSLSKGELSDGAFAGVYTIYLTR